MKKGDVWWVELADAHGHEQRGERPAVILGKANGMTAVISMTANAGRAVLSHTLIIEPVKENGLTKDSVALIFHLRSLDKTRFKRRLGEVTAEEMAATDEMTADFLNMAAKQFT